MSGYYESRTNISGYNVVPRPFGGGGQGSPRHVNAPAGGGDGHPQPVHAYAPAPAPAHPAPAPQAQHQAPQAQHQAQHQQQSQQHQESSKTVFHAQYNDPSGLYSGQSAADAYLHQTGGLFGTDPALAKPKVEASFLNSATLRLIQENEGTESHGHGQHPHHHHQYPPPPAQHIYEDRYAQGREETLHHSEAQQQSGSFKRLTTSLAVDDSSLQDTPVVQERQHILEETTHGTQQDIGGGLLTEAQPGHAPSGGGAPPCDNCGRIITGVFCKAGGKSLHPDCFRCTTCGTNLKNTGYFVVNNKLYCEIHAKQHQQSQFSPRPPIDPGTFTKTPPGPPPRQIPSQDPIKAFYQPEIMKPGPISPVTAPWRSGASAIAPQSRGVPGKYNMYTSTTSMSTSMTSGAGGSVIQPVYPPGLVSSGNVGSSAPIQIAPIPMPSLTNYSAPAAAPAPPPAPAPAPAPAPMSAPPPSSGGALGGFRGTLVEFSTKHSSVDDETDTIELSDTTSTVIECTTDTKINDLVETDLCSKILKKDEGLEIDILSVPLVPQVQAKPLKPVWYRVPKPNATASGDQRGSEKTLHPGRLANINWPPPQSPFRNGEGKEGYGIRSGSGWKEYAPAYKVPTHPQAIIQPLFRSEDEDYMKLINFRKSHLVEGAERRPPSPLRDLMRQDSARNRIERQVEREERLEKHRGSHTFVPQIQLREIGKDEFMSRTEEHQLKPTPSGLYSAEHNLGRSADALAKSAIENAQMSLVKETHQLKKIKNRTDSARKVVLHNGAGTETQFRNPLLEQPQNLDNMIDSLIRIADDSSGRSQDLELEKYDNVPHNQDFYSSAEHQINYRPDPRSTTYRDDYFSSPALGSQDVRDEFFIQYKPKTEHNQQAPPQFSEDFGENNPQPTSNFQPVLTYEGGVVENIDTQGSSQTPLLWGPDAEEIERQVNAMFEESFGAEFREFREEHGEEHFDPGSGYQNKDIPPEVPPPPITEAQSSSMYALGSATGAQPSSIYALGSPLATGFHNDTLSPKEIIQQALSTVPDLQATGFTPSGGGGVPTSATGGQRQMKRGKGILKQLADVPRIPICESCRKEIRGPFVLALGKTWCPDHFACANGQCRRQLIDVGFVEESNQIYCEFCFEKYLAPICAKCARPVVGDCLNAIEKQWHPDCFCCTHCQKPFGNSTFYLEDGKPYCDEDWNVMFTTKCNSCQFPIEAGDKWVEALGASYHSNCFTCTESGVCNRQ